MKISKADLLLFLRRILPWALLALVPLFVNLFFWEIGTVPSEARFRSLQTTLKLAEMKPELESLLTEGARLLAEGEEQSFVREDPAMGMKELQKLAGDFGVQIKEIRMNEAPSLEVMAAAAKKPAPDFMKIPVELEVAGTYNKLIGWMSAVEKEPSLQIETWSLASPKKQEETTRLSMNLSVIFKNT